MTFIMVLELSTEAHFNLGPHTVVRNIIRRGGYEASNNHPVAWNGEMHLQFSEREEGCLGC